ncbi:secreted RxLR effector protein 161-like [Vigna angularis]|uniref:secreted RxLR effector protein 161-like n=1 Tax=Phaseolus angularis TaxID=3914 RepID=UPI0022B3F6C5|nr:secreted RxLR effector protein 161-like [Vigna angularis]
MQTEFEMTDLDKLSYFLGMEVVHTEVGMIMHQRKYVKDLLERFKMNQCNAVKSPLEVNVKLMNDDAEETVNETLPDLAFYVGVTSRFMNQPRRSHLLAVKRIIRYIKGTLNTGILFPYERKKRELELIGFCDSDYGGDMVERKSTSGYIFFLNEAPISWCSKIVALSSCEAE